MQTTPTASQPAPAGFFTPHEPSGDTMKTLYTPSQIDRLMVETFSAGRQARSKPYRQGVRDMLENRLSQTPFPACCFAPGRCEFDAYFAGQDEGRTIARRICEQKDPA